MPNVSEGRRKVLIDALASAITSVEGVTLLDVDPDESHNRTVITFVGARAPVLEAAFQLTKKASDLIDLNHHKGEHPRMGATDVVPFVPVRGVSMDECVALAQKLGERIGAELRIPVFLYGEAASRPERKNLPDVRKGEFEGLRDLIGKDPSRDPDYGPKRIHPTAGATAVGARPFLIAYNVNLETRDLAVAKEIASKVREKDGGLPAVRALGFELADRGLVQVSMNLIDFRKTPPAAAFDAVSRQARDRGVPVHASEVVGLIPLDALPEGAVARLKLERFSKDQILEFRVFGESAPGLGEQMARVMGTSPSEGSHSKSQSLEGFLSALASGDPTPGGGAASALMGSVGASLALMGCRLTHGKPEFDASRARLQGIEARASELQNRLVKAIDEDVRAYNAVLDALRLPKATPEEKAARTAALQKAFRWATEVPLSVAGQACEVIEICEELVKIGLQSAESDVGVGGLAARAAVDGAALNVLINLGSIKDEGFVRESRATLSALRERAVKGTAALEEHVRKSLG